MVRYQSWKLKRSPICASRLFLLPIRSSRLFLERSSGPTHYTVVAADSLSTDGTVRTGFLRLSSIFHFPNCHIPSLWTPFKFSFPSSGPASTWMKNGSNRRCDSKNTEEGKLKWLSLLQACGLCGPHHLLPRGVKPITGPEGGRPQHQGCPSPAALGPAHSRSAGDPNRDVTPHRAARKSFQRRVINRASFKMGLIHRERRISSSAATAPTKAPACSLASWPSPGMGEAGTSRQKASVLLVPTRHCAPQPVAQAWSSH